MLTLFYRQCQNSRTITKPRELGMRYKNQPNFILPLHLFLMCLRLIFCVKCFLLKIFWQISADVDTLHTILSVERHHDVVSLTTRLEENWEELFGTQYDIIAFLYSVVLTKVAQTPTRKHKQGAW